MPTAPATWRFASVTKRLPGPTILSTRGSVRVAERERGDRLRAADLKQARHARELGRGQHRVVHSARRRHHHDVRHPGDHRGNDVHDDGGWVGRFAAGHVDAHPLERHDPHAERVALRIALEESRIALRLALVIRPHPRDRRLAARPCSGGGCAAECLLTPDT